MPCTRWGFRQAVGRSRRALPLVVRSPAPFASAVRSRRQPAPGAGVGPLPPDLLPQRGDLVLVARGPAVRDSFITRMDAATASAATPSAQAPSPRSPPTPRRTGGRENGVMDEKPKQGGWLAGA